MYELFFAMKSIVILVLVNSCLALRLTGAQGQAGRRLGFESLSYSDFLVEDFAEAGEYAPNEIKGIMEGTNNSLNHSSTTDRNAKIVGGQEAPVGAFPYQVGLFMHKANGSRTWCGGVLISDQFVLTAAHCMRSTKSVTVILGAHDRLNSTEPGQIRQNVASSNLLPHPKYINRKNDIGLIRLNGKLDFTPQIQPIALPDGTNSFVNRTGIVSGWGYYDGQANLADKLRYTHATITSGSVCKRKFGKSFSSANICLHGSKPGKTCKGDSGGPFNVQSADRGVPILVGIVSYGSSNGCLKRSPSVLTRVSTHLQWIAKNTRIPIS